jgi:NAD(P)H dehydrogenase (quinone)
MSDHRIVITGASGKLGSKILSRLIKWDLKTPLIASSRRVMSAETLGSPKVGFRLADFEKPDDLRMLLNEGDRLFMVSTTQLSQRLRSHANVVAASKQARVSRLIYSSVLRADSSPLKVSEDHRLTEQLIAKSGVPWVILRNTWYSENKLRFLADFIGSGELIGCSGEGVIRSAARSDLAEAAARMLASPHQAPNQLFELAGDTAFTMTELAKIISEVSGVNVVYRDVSESEYVHWLEARGVPAKLAHFTAEVEASAKQGWLDTPSRDLSKILGRPTISMRTLVEQAVAEFDS